MYYCHLLVKPYYYYNPTETNKTDHQNGLNYDTNILSDEEISRPCKNVSGYLVELNYTTLKVNK